MIDTIDQKSLARRVGHMTYEQVRPLFEEAKRQCEERRGCPDCHYNKGNNWHTCDAYNALRGANKHHISQIVKELRAHTKSCPDCYVESQWEEFESHCDRCQEKINLFHLYSHRLNRIEFNERVKRFELAHGRKPLKLELWQWEEAQT